MNAKTPKFNEALGNILSELKPHTRVCKQCEKEFDITAEDIEFYHKLQVPPPTLCPRCRLQRRLGPRVSLLPIFHKKMCSAAGHDEKVITYYSEDNPIKVYDDKYYLSDRWDAADLGVDIDANKDFFPQFQKFSLTVPHQTLFKDPQSINCDYVVSGVSSKDCYFVSAPILSEFVYYSFVPLRTKDAVDVNRAIDSERCFEAVNIKECYNCKFSYEVSNCIDSAFFV